jgi:hypothetical protein
VYEKHQLLMKLLLGATLEIQQYLILRGKRAFILFCLLKSVQVTVIIFVFPVSWNRAIQMSQDPRQYSSQYKAIGWGKQKRFLQFLQFL